MQNLSIAGNLGQDPELKSTSGGNTVLSFSVACSGYNRREKQKTTTWYRISLWGKRAEQLANLLEKGSRVACSGELEVGEWNGKVQLNLTVQDVTLLGGQQGGGSGGGRPAAGKAAPASDPGDEDIPF
jgi:single-strand DNA-binding protein